MKPLYASILVMFGLMTPSIAQAYLDPVTGSFLVQGILAVFLAPSWCSGIKLEPLFQASLA